MVEKCITIAKKGLLAQKVAAEFGTDAEKNSPQWKQWRESPNYAKWQQASSPAVFARRRLIQILCDKQAVDILFNDLAERFEDRPGGYTRIMRLATPRLGDNGTRAILEFVGRNDRVVKRSEKPDFGDDSSSTTTDSGAQSEAPSPSENTPAE